MTSKNNRAPLLYDIKLCASFHSHHSIQAGVTARKRSIWVKIGDFFVPSDLEIWQMTLKNDRAPLLCCFKLCASFQSHGWIKTGVTNRKLSIRVKIGEFLSQVTSKFDGWPWKTIGQLFYAVSSFVHHFRAISEFILELQSGNAQFGSKSAFFFSGDLEIWQTTLKNNRASFLCCFKFFASFQSHWWIQTASYSPQMPNLGQNRWFFFSCVSLKFDRWPRN